MRSQVATMTALALALPLAGSAFVGSAAAAEATITYVVRPGDTLYDLAIRGLKATSDYRIVQQRNRVANPRRLPIGAQLVIPERLLRTAPVAARLTAFKGEVVLTRAGRPQPAVKDTVLGEGDVISTGAHAFARLNLPDGSRVALPSQSRVRVVRMRTTLLTGAVEREFMVEAGGGDSVVTPMEKPQDRYIIRTPLSVSAVRGTEFRVWYAPDEQRTATEVLDGAVAVGVGAATTVAAANFAVATGRDGAAVSVPLPPPPNLRGSGKAQDEPELAFEVDPVEGARAYRAQIAADAGFIEIVGDNRSDAPRLAFESLPDGVYFVRATVVNHEGIEGRAATYAFERHLNTLTPEAPSAEQTGRLKRYLFRWAVSGEGARTYRFQIRRQETDTTPMIDQIGLTEPRITLTDLPPGDYVWRVMSRTFVRGRYVDKWSAEQRFKNGG